MNVSKDFELVLDQLLNLENPTNLKIVGEFFWVKYLDPRNRERLRHECGVITNSKNETSKAYHAWFLNISIKHAELIEKFSSGPLAGRTSVTKYKRGEGKLVRGKSKLISIS